MGGPESCADGERGDLRGDWCELTPGLPVAQSEMARGWEVK